MIIEQLYDDKLAHGSYIIISNGEAAVVDPARNPQPYIDLAELHHAKVVAVLETHPHADFVSSHLEFLNDHGATVYIHPKVGVAYPHTPVVHGDVIKVGNVTFETLFTPGHSPDHNSYLLREEGGEPVAVFTGDSLFIGDVGRPDLREKAGNMTGKRAELAGMMFDTVNDVFRQLPDFVKVYPAHGAGSLCGKNMSEDSESTIAREKATNWAFKMTDKQAFVEALLEGQPFVPKYFPNSVEVNRVGAPSYVPSVQSVARLPKNAPLEAGVAVVDIRQGADFKAGHLAGAFNIPNTEGDRFETWTGSIINPGESFYLVSDDAEKLENAIRRLAKIGYELQIKGAVVYDADQMTTTSPAFDIDHFLEHVDSYTIVDIRNWSEVETNGKKFASATVVPLPELREQYAGIPADKPVVVHCAGGYRSAIGSSIMLAHVPGAQILDMSEFVKTIDIVNA